jgi:hypothetical protein
MKCSATDSIQCLINACFKMANNLQSNFRDVITQEFDQATDEKDIDLCYKQQFAELLFEQ